MKKSFFVCFIILISFVFFINFGLAGEPTQSEDNTLNTSGSAVKLTNPLTGTQASESIPVFLGKIISYAMGIIGSLALVMFIYGGAVWMLSRGNQEQVSKGKNIIIWATLGLAIIFTAYALIRFVILAIGGT